MHINHVHVYVGLYDINTRFRRSGIGEIIKQMPFTEPIWTSGIVVIYFDDFLCSIYLLRIYMCVNFIISSAIYNTLTYCLNNAV